jgi:hypothetical protein
MSVPPNGLPEPELSLPNTFTGAKYCAIPSFCSSVVAFSSHIRRKNAIIAVTKSA